MSTKCIKKGTFYPINAKVNLLPKSLYYLKDHYISICMPFLTIFILEIFCVPRFNDSCTLILYEYKMSKKRYILPYNRKSQPLAKIAILS